MDRIRFVYWAGIIAFFAMGLGITNLSVIHGKKYRELSDRNCIRLMPQEGSRGRILDREGDIIADNRVSYDVMLLPQDLAQADSILSGVSGILDVEVGELKKALKSENSAESIPVVIAKNIDIKKAIALEESRFELPGILIQPKPQRFYPYGQLCAHVLGYLSQIDRWRLTRLEDYGYKTRDIVGFGGVEEKYDYYLRQDEGGLSFEVDHRGRFVRTLGFRQPRNGRDIQLTLNLKIQGIVERHLAGKVGAVVIMDPYSGEVISLASYPNFNPKAFVDKRDLSVSGIFNDPDSPLINRAISGLYPAGSLFKVIVATAGLETKKIGLSTSYMCQGTIFIGKEDFKCWDTHDQQSLIPAIAHSCNVFFYKVGLLLGPQLIHDYAVKFGLSKPTLFDLPYEESGFIPSPLWRNIYRFRKWFEGDTANLSIGQGEVLVTPLQMARVMSVFANRGNLVNPYIVGAVDGKDISAYQKRAMGLSLNKNTVDYIRRGLRAVITDPQGTGNVLSGLSISIAGKTGTAQAPPGQPHAWFVGFFPYENPKFVICVLLERGGPGLRSCVLAKEIIEEMIQEGLI